MCHRAAAVPRVIPEARRGLWAAAAFLGRPAIGALLCRAPGLWPWLLLHGLRARARAPALVLGPPPRQRDEAELDGARGGAALQPGLRAGCPARPRDGPPGEPLVESSAPPASATAATGEAGLSELGRPAASEFECPTASAGLRCCGVCA
ncbi:unnamed protein product [Prorocentrum cordatum]|uniref:Uncharacterized protein n=1 Tax=Prorocentrum cordatum TaxID=2364126 RepID=A0ABN9R3T9_9DINO|nr:unnamed protein product [Polarella glacialis]